QSAQMHSAGWVPCPERLFGKCHSPRAVLPRSEDITREPELLAVQAQGAREFRRHALGGFAETDGTFECRPRSPVITRPLQNGALSLQRGSDTCAARIDGCLDDLHCTIRRLQTVDETVGPEERAREVVEIFDELEMIRTELALVQRQRPLQGFDGC